MEASARRFLARAVLVTGAWLFGGCGRTGLLGCLPNGVQQNGISCPVPECPDGGIAHTESKVTCSCTCCFNFGAVFNGTLTGDVPLCLPEFLNAHLATQQELCGQGNVTGPPLESLTDEQLAVAAGNWCNEVVGNSLITVAEEALANGAVCITGSHCSIFHGTSL